ncbi:PD40 domain-containing protein [Arenicella xantha]|uniref:WD40 repeat protein n=1 Tax=Arenicella xantha TaxID=644221 RepID=A0A395JK66_9GAMM|nr:PD40 domain-containing protein [Arenicella xantha]RBP51122.1 WD40 repeat protein [Arenicella xantha]
MIFIKEYRTMRSATRSRPISACTVGLLAFAIGAQSYAEGLEFSDPKQLNHILRTNERVLQFEVGGDSKRMIYHVTNLSTQYGELRVAPLSGNAEATRINTSNLRDYDMSADGKYVVYTTSNSPFTSANRLNSQVSDMSEPAVQLIPALSSGKEVARPEISPDGHTVVFISEERQNNLRELYSVPITGPSSSRVRLSGPLDPPDESSVVGVGGFYISPDSSTVVYFARPPGSTVAELYSVPIDRSSEPVQLTDLNTNNRRISGSIMFSPDSTTISFVSNQGVNDVYNLYSIPINGPKESAIRLNHDSDGESVRDSRISADGTTIVYRSAGSSSDLLYSVPIDRSTEPVLISPIPVFDGDVSQYYEISSDSSTVVFKADMHINNVSEIFAVPINGPSTSAIKLHQDLVVGQSVATFDKIELSPDGQSVTFRIDDSVADNLTKLYTAPLDTANAAVDLTPMLVNDQYVQSSFKLSADSEYVVYIANQEDDIYELYLATLDGQQPPLKLNAALPDGGRIGTTFLSDKNIVRISADSSSIVYAAEQIASGLGGLFVVRKIDDEICFVTVASNNKVVTFCL